MSYNNLPQLHRQQAERLGPSAALRHKRHGLYHDVSWQRYRADALACAAALVEVGIRPGDRVGLVSENRQEWLLADMGILTAGAVNVPPHAPLTASQIQYQLADAGARWVFVSGGPQLAKVEQVRASLPELQGVVVFEGPEARGDAVSWDAFLQRGRRALARTVTELARREDTLRPDDLATVMYTSGTTGNPKGVMLTHGNLLSNTFAVLEVFPFGWDSVPFNWLPLSHIYARTVDYYLSVAAGTVLCLAESAETVVQNLADVQPTHISAVPRFYEKVLAAVAAPDPATTGKRLRDVFGPRMMWRGSGGAPLPVPVARAYHDAGVPVLQGYGLTESSPVITFNRPGRYKIETVGLPLPGVEVAIAPDGEILTRGPHVMRGYWNNPQATAEAIRDGWLYTGDLGRLDEDGFLSITGRKKELLVLSNGKKVVPTFIEGLLLADPCIDQVVVYGEGRSYLTALVVPNWQNVRRGLAEEGVTVDHQAEEALAGDDAVRRLLDRHITAALNDVAGCEQVRKFIVLPRPFTIAADELTVSLKLRRGVVCAKYRAELERLYEQ
jgi:long-chain acyl-CoA synthetase